MTAHRSADATTAVTPAVTLGLLAAWALHDAEEVALGPRWLKRHLPELRARFPQLPDRVWRAMERVDQGEFATAVAFVGGVVAAAATAGHLTGGRSALYQSALDGFGLHGLVHLAQAAAVRGYTPGSATSPLLVIPFTVWARHRLHRAGVLRPTRARDAVLALVAAGAVTTGAHLAAHRLATRHRR
ncbi:HXXEE domain-containing protein [Streptomyces sp. NPDC058045]|uniref:HXXEE domain-containing protein n=1 Tax=Streptomyces sp. NPDC058045 TaxID=3346311 RepID=UPI0036EC9395